MLEECDDNGSILDGNYGTIKEGTIWDFPEDKIYRFIGGEIRLEEKSNNLSWIEISQEKFKRYFVKVGE